MSALVKALRTQVFEAGQQESPSFNFRQPLLPQLVTFVVVIEGHDITFYFSQKYDGAFWEDS